MEEYSKPLSMKLFSTWEGERTAPHCIPRTCTFKLQAVKLTKPLDTDISNLLICASMSIGNFRRSLRTDEIYPDKSGLAELDYCFSFQYPHYLKREENILKLSLQRRKRYRNRAMLGYKTVAIGHIDLAQIMQYPTDDKLKLFAKGGGFQVACLHLHQITSIPHESIRNHSRENSSTDDDDMFYPSDDDMDSEGDERAKKKPKPKDDMKLKKKFNALLRKMKINDAEDEPMMNDETAPMTDQYSATYSSIIADISDDSARSDSDSIGTLPKPHLRPYFTADFDCEDKSEKGSSTDEAASGHADCWPADKPPGIALASFRKQKEEQPINVAKRKISEDRKSSVSPVTSQRPSKTSISHSTAPPIGDIRQEAEDESTASPLRQSPTSQDSFPDDIKSSLDEVSEEHNMTVQLEVLFNKGDMLLPDAIDVAYCTRDNVNHPVIKAMLSTTGCIFLHSSCDAKLFISTLVNKMQKFLTRHSRLTPVKLTIIGAFSSSNLILKPLMDSLNNKSSEWVQNFHLIFLPTDVDNPLARHVSMIDESYGKLLDTIFVECELDVLAAYQREAREVVKLSVGRVLLSQATEDSNEDAKQFEVPFLHSVSIVFSKKSCANCLAADSSDEDADKCREHETDIQVDYASISNKKEASSAKQAQVKGIFRELGVSREFGEQNITLKAAYREKKGKVGISRLKKQQDILNLNCNVNSFTCMIRTTGLTCTVRVDGVKHRNVLSLFVSPLWSQNLNLISLVTSPNGGVLC